MLIQDAVTHWHLQDHDHKGDAFLMGNCPKLLDETCYFLATDVDKASWETDAIAFFNTCHRMNFPTALERPRSGNGAHVT